MRLVFSFSRVHGGGGSNVAQPTDGNRSERRQCSSCQCSSGKSCGLAFMWMLTDMYHPPNHCSRTQFFMAAAFPDSSAPTQCFEEHDKEFKVMWLASKVPRSQSNLEPNPQRPQTHRIKGTSAGVLVLYITGDLRSFDGSVLFLQLKGTYTGDWPM